MKKFQHVRLTKLVGDQPGSFPVQYWCAGILIGDITIGAPITLARYARAAQESGEPSTVSRLGLYRSSPVLSIEENGRVRTQNSTWQVTELGTLDEETKAILDTMSEYFPSVMGTLNPENETNSNP